MGYPESSRSTVRYVLGVSWVRWGIRGPSRGSVSGVEIVVDGGPSADAGAPTKA